MMPVALFLVPFRFFPVAESGFVVGFHGVMGVFSGFPVTYFASEF
jgi:hypothetical protein